MKSFITTLLLFITLHVFSASVSYQDEKAGILWRVSGYGLKSDSYILGTNHTFPISFLDSLKGFHEAWDKVTQVATESEFADIMDSVQHGNLGILEKYYAKEQKPVAKSISHEEYKDIFTKDQLAFMDSVLKPFVVSNMTVAEMSPLRLWYQYINNRDFSISNKFSVKDPMDFFKNAMDGMLERRCKSSGKRHIPLEEYSTGTNALDSSLMIIDSYFDLKDQADILYQCALYEASSKNKSTEKDLDSAYQENNFIKYSDCFMKQSEYINSLSLSSKLKARFMQYEKKKKEIDCKQRTINWMDNILKEIKFAPTLVAVGINHFIGENGLINLLRQHGYTVEPVK